MGYPTKVQQIKRKQSEQYYISFPSALAKAMEFVPSETVEWIIEDKGQLVLRRLNVPASALKKKLQKTSSSASKIFGEKRATHSSRKEHGKGRRRSR